MRLFWKIYSITLIVFVVTIALLTYGVSIRRISEAEARIVDQQRIMGSHLASEIRRWQDEGRWPFEALRALSHQDGFKFWWIVNEAGTIHLADRVEFVGTGAGAYFRNAPTTITRQGDLLLDEDENYGLYRQSFRTGTHNWSFWYGFSTSAIRAARQDILQTTLIYSGLSILALGLALMFAMRRLLRPLQDLSRGVRALSQGQLDSSIAVQSQDELGRLAQAFNDMSAKLHEAFTSQSLEIAERRRTEEALRQSEENLSITLDSIGDAVIATDAEGRITRMNRVAESLTGWPGSEARGLPLDDVMPLLDAQTRAALPSPAARVLATGETVDPESRALLVARDGTEYRIADSCAPIRSHASGIVGTVLVFRDVTRDSLIQEQLRQSQKMEAVGQLAGGVAHDFNNMLGGIVGATELLSRRVNGDLQSARCVALILQAADHAAALTAKLLTFARKQPAVSTPTDVHQAITDTVTLLSSTLDRRLKIITSFGAHESTVLGDPSQLQSVFLNLGLNASHAMTDGGELTFATRNVTLDQTEQIEIDVRDTGAGIAPENIERIFEPFFTTKQPGKGTGLGLAAVFSSVRQHGGTIGVRSEPARGTVFRITLPLTSDRSLPAVPSSRPVSGTGCILVVDDEEIMRVTTRAMLESLGYEVLLADNGQTALEVFRREHQRIDLVLLDMVMPVLDGRDCFVAMRQLVPDMPIVSSSGFVRDDDLAELKAAGLSGSLSKPYRRATLSQVIAKALEGRKRSSASPGSAQHAQPR